MTIAAAYLLSEGVVFGTDSSSTISSPAPDGSPQVLQVLSHCQKLFEIGQGSRLGACTWGAGCIGEHSHRRIFALLADRLPPEATVADASNLLVEIARPLVAQAGTDYVGYYLGGWDRSDRRPSCYKIEFNRGTVTSRPLQIGVCSFSGAPVFFSRVFHGCDPELKSRLLGRLIEEIPEERKTDFTEKFNRSFDELTGQMAAIGFPDLSIREAIDFIHSYLHITIKAFKFKFGAPICGGPIEIGFVSVDRPLRWAFHKPFNSAVKEYAGELA